MSRSTRSKGGERLQMGWGARGTDAMRTGEKLFQRGSTSCFMQLSVSEAPR